MAGALMGGMAIGQISSAIQTKLALDEARRVRAFQERMYRNRYKYTMGDMERAGLNPILAASVGGGTQPQGAMGKIADIPSAVGGPKESLSALRLKQELTNMRAQYLNTQQDTATKYGLERKAHEEANSAKASAALMETGLAEKAAEEKFYKTPYLGQGTKTIDKIIRAISPFIK